MLFFCGAIKIQAGECFKTTNFGAIEGESDVYVEWVSIDCLDPVGFVLAASGRWNFCHSKFKK
jgi:hypothetical protein